MKYRILSLDGGGSWALIQARVLLDLYGDIRGHELLKKFDLAIANSGGSLILACLCNDMHLTEIIDVLRTEGSRKMVFSKLTFWEKLNWRNIASLVTRKLGPRYRTKRKIEGLRTILTEKDHLFQSGKIKTPIVDTPLHEIPAIIQNEQLQLLIVGFDYFRERVTFFRSNYRSNTDSFGSGDFYAVNLGDAIHSSSNAPVNYFDEPAEITIQRFPATDPDKRSSWFWDGAVSGFNNPVLAGLVEAMTNDPGKNEKVNYCILSIGCSIGSFAVLTDALTSTIEQVKRIAEINKQSPFAITNATSGFVKDITKMSTSILSDPPDSATFIAYSILDPLLNGTGNLVRINPCLSPEKNPATGLYVPPIVYQGEARKLYHEVLNLGMDAVDDREVDLIADLCDRFIKTDDTPALPNQLIRGNTAGKFLGQPTYKEAKQKWQLISG